ncbi:suppressor of HU sensitivity involved in recombination protein 1 [Monosporozyma unispora]|nr:hypothetical protein C6P44_000951 [Kazachstania unispora]
MNNKIRSHILDLVKSNLNEKSLIIVLGESSRQFIETELKTLLVNNKDEEKIDGLTIKEIRHLHEDIKILFLNRLQYLFMYLTHLEVDNVSKTTTVSYDNIIIYGLDQLLCNNDEAQPDNELQTIRLGQLILNCFYSLPRHYTNMNLLLSIPFSEDENRETHILNQINSYCRYINGID